MWFLEVLKENFPFIKKRKSFLQKLDKPSWVKLEISLHWTICTHCRGLTGRPNQSLSLSEFRSSSHVFCLLLLSISFFSVVYIRVLFCSISISYLFLRFGHLLTQKTHTWTNTNKALDSFCVSVLFRKSVCVHYSCIICGHVSSRVYVNEVKLAGRQHSHTGSFFNLFSSPSIYPSFDRVALSGARTLRRDKN